MKHSNNVGIRGWFLSVAVRVARFYIRYSPIYLFKPFLWSRIKWREHPYIARTKFGATMKGNSLDAVQGRIYYFGLWEPNLTEFLRRKLVNQSNRTFIDVGANVGYFSILAAKLMPAGNVISIEAYPAIFEKLKDNIALNKLTNVRLVPRAATDKECTIDIFHAGEKNEGGTTTLLGKFCSIPLSVPGEPLSLMLTDADVESALVIKIDVEGAEHSVIKGMKSIMGRLRDDVAIVIEIAADSSNQEIVLEMMNFFSNFGFFPYELENSYLDSSYLSPLPISRPMRLKGSLFKQTDIVFSKVNHCHL